MIPNVPEITDLSAYDFALPANLIAQFPVTPRDSSRLLVVDRKSGELSHRTFRDIIEYLDSNDVLVANNSRVMKARLLGHRILAGTVGHTGQGGLGGKVEFLLLEKKGHALWEGMIHSSARAIKGFRFEVYGIVAEVTQGMDESAHGTVVARFEVDPVDAGVGEIPLPPYIERNSDRVAEKGASHQTTLSQSSNDTDEARYQTVYAKEVGSAAAPTAGFHFTPELIQKLQQKGVSWEEVTLNVGVGTFRPVKSPDVRSHLMHSESYTITEGTANALNLARRNGKHIVAVGTTAVRTLESSVKPEANFGVSSVAEIGPGTARTSIFIRPGAHTFQMTDRLITNFHLPKSTLLMLVCAFAGYELTMKAYREAVENKYRFYSYGDAMVIL